MYCSKCGALVKDGAVYCPACGERVVGGNRGAEVDNAYRSFVNTSQGNKGEVPQLIECTVCKHQISSQAEICPHCGNKTSYGNQMEKNREKKKEEKNFQWLSVVMNLVGLVGIVMFGMAISTMINDRNSHSYTYSAPYTEHELHYMYMLLFGAIMIACDVGTSIGLKIRKKKGRYPYNVNAK